MKRNLVDRINEKAAEIGAKTREIYDFVIENPAERLKRAGSDLASLTLMNTLILGCFEANFGTTLGDLTPKASADLRAIVAPSNPILGLLRDVGRHRKGIDKKDDDKESRGYDFKLFAKVAGVEFLLNLGKYCGTKLINGEELRPSDLLLSLIAAGYTLSMGKQMGRIIETFRDGYGIDSTNNHGSYFPKNMSASAKKIRTAGLSVVSGGALAAYFAMTR